MTGSALKPDERSFLDEAAETGVYALQFAEGNWWKRWEDSRPWTPEMAAYRDALAADLDRRINDLNERSPIDKTAAKGAFVPTYALITMRGD